MQQLLLFFLFLAIPFTSSFAMNGSKDKKVYTNQYLKNRPKTANPRGLAPLDHDPKARRSTSPHPVGAMESQSKKNFDKMKKGQASGGDKYMMGHDKVPPIGSGKKRTISRKN